MTVRFLDRYDPKIGDGLVFAAYHGDVFSDIDHGHVIEFGVPGAPYGPAGEFRVNLAEAGFDYFFYVPWNTEGLSLPPRDERVIKQHVVGSAEAGDLRHVYQLIGPESGLNLRVGLTVHMITGGWSSTPHPFEEMHIKSPAPPDFKEWFGYMTDPADGWGIQVKTGHIFGHTQWDDEDDPESLRYINESVFVRAGQIEQIPLGSHPLTGAPGVRMAYFWAYTGKLIHLMEKF